MAVLATGTSDPDFYQRKLALARQSLASMAEGYRRRQAEAEERELREIEMFKSAVQAMPELAHTWGQELKKKYGDRYGVGPTVDVLTQRDRLRTGVESAGREFYNTWDQMAQEYQARQQRVQGQPDYLPSMLGPVPNFGKAMEQRELGKIDPTRMAQAAAAALPPSKRAAALAWAKQEYGQEIPDYSTANMFQVLPKDQAALYALDQFPQMDQTGEIRNSLRYGLELEQSPQRLQEQGFQRDQAGAAREAETAQIGTRDANARALEDLKYRHSLDRITANEASQRRVLDHRRVLFPPRDPAGRQKDETRTDFNSILKDNDRRIRDWEGRLRSQSLGARDKKEAAAKRTAYESSNPRPRRLTNSEARALSTVINGIGDAESRAVLGDRVVSAYEEARRAGRNGVEALDEAKRMARSDPGLRAGRAEDLGVLDEDFVPYTPVTPKSPEVKSKSTGAGTIRQLGADPSPARSGSTAPRTSGSNATTPPSRARTARPALATTLNVEAKMRAALEPERKEIEHRGMSFDVILKRMMDDYHSKVGSGMAPKQALEEVLR